MKTLMIRNGDLVPGPDGFETVTGSRKVAQDLRMAVGEPLGTDRFHPGFGSRLDTYVGVVNDESVRFEVEQEVTRVVQNYVAVQRDMIQRDMATGGRSRFTTDDVVGSVDSIKATSLYDAVNVRVQLRTLAKTGVLVELDTVGGTDA